MARAQISDRINVPDIERFEAQAAQTVGEMKALFGEFEARLGEVVSAQRLASSEARNEAAKARAALEELARQAKAMVDAQGRTLEEVRQGWRFHVAENSRAAGEEIARAFGVRIATGLCQKLEGMSTAVERATRRLEWTTVGKWTAGIATGVVMTIALGVWAMLPHAEGLSWSYVRAGATRLQPCEAKQEVHVCVVIDREAGMVKGVNGEALAVVRGM